MEFSVTLPQMLGFVITIFACLSLAINLFVLYILWTGRLLTSGSSSIYLMAFSNIVANCIQAGLIAFYLGPSIFLQSYLFTDGLKGIGNSILSCLETGAWYTDMQLSAVIAINRVFIIVFTETGNRIFTRPVVKSISIIIIFTGFGLAIVSHLLIPGGSNFFDYSSYWQIYTSNGTNYNDYFIDTPQNTLSSLICIICYTTVYLHIRKSYKKINNAYFMNTSEVKRKNEIRYAIQFGALSLFALIAWVGMRAIPLILNSGNVYPYVTFAVIMHGTTNSLIFLVMNKEVFIFREEEE